MVIFEDRFLKPTCYKTEGPEKAHFSLSTIPGGKPVLELWLKGQRNRGRNRYRIQSELSSTLAMPVLTVKAQELFVLSTS